MSNKKIFKNSKENEKIPKKSNVKTQLISDYKDDKTELIMPKSNNENKINHLNNDDSSSFVLKLVDKNNNSKVFTCVVDNVVVLGRRAELCDLAIDYDRTVSSRQCKVYVKCNNLYVSDLGGTNLTYLNNKPLSEDVPLYEGDILSFGRINLRVSIVKNN